MLLLLPGRAIQEADSRRGQVIDARFQIAGVLLFDIDDAIGAFPAHVQAELSQLLALLASAPGRVGLAGLTTDWPSASVEQIQAALQSMRTSSFSLRQQAYHALHDITSGAYFSDPSTWVVMGYPGPLAL